MSRPLLPLRISAIDGQLYLTVHVRRGQGGDWPLALIIKILLTPLKENFADMFIPSSFEDRVSIIA